VNREYIRRLRQKETQDYVREINAGADKRGRGGHFYRVGGRGRHTAGGDGHDRRQETRDQGERRADHPSADVRCKAFARAAQVDRKHPRQIIAPEAELADREQPDKKHADRQQTLIGSRRDAKHERHK
jgi:hypothetical protein